MDNSLRIKVGAALDANTKSVYKPLVDITKAAAKDILEIWKKLANDMGVAFNKGGSKIVVTTKTTGDASKAMARVFGSSADEIRQSFDRMAESAKQSLDLKQLASAAESELKKVERAAARTRLGFGNGNLDRYARNTGYWSMIYGDRAIRSGINFAGSIARGAGIDFNIGSMVRKVADQQMMARQISNEGYMPQDPNNDKRRSVEDIRGRAKEVADYAGFDRGDALSGLQTFVGHTGDLSTGLDIIKQIAKTSRATGAELEDMVSAAADFSNALGDVPHKAEEIEAITRVLGGQAKTGAVSMRELPKSMVKLTAQAHNFVMSPETAQIFADQGVNTKTGQAIATMGVLAQMAKFRGGATSASTATQDAMAFIRDASSRTELARWTAVGLNPFANKQHTQIKDPKRLIMEALDYSKGSLDKIATIMPNRQSQAIIKSFLPAYTEAGGGNAGLKAVSAQYDRIAKSGVSKKEEQDSFDLAMKETVPKVQQFENKLQDTAEKISGKILPAFERLEPTILELTEKFGGMVAWAAENPAKAITAAIVASIARSGIENALRMGVENLIKNVGENGALGMSSKTLKGAAGNAAAFLSIASVAIATATIGMAVIDHFFSEKDKEDRKKFADSATVENDLRGVEFGKGKISPEEQVRRLEADRDRLRKTIPDLGDQTGVPESLRAHQRLSPEQQKNQELLNSIDQTLKDLLTHSRASSAPPAPSPLVTRPVEQ